MARRTKEEALATRETIIDAAETVFSEKGVARASLEEIATEAGCTRGAIYWHFKDKAELFDAMMQRVVLPVEAMLESAGVSGETDPLELLRLATVEILQRTARDPQLARVFEIAYHKCEYTGDAAGVRDRHIASQAECMGTIEAGFRACVAQGLLPESVSPREAAIGAMSLVSGLIANWVLDPKSFSLAKHAESLVDTYFRGLQAKPAASAKPRARAAPRPRLKAVK
ncbi:TetR family transcriptional regulator [Usitatibacter palustris]|uniref:HTH-type transcriptional regulator TtgR n=1 Tax=Usitatibacter palustris TaxID=2732487 RepID=A0A6M4H844_9PROT|nr:TetR family transcriptional regulator [Usitatibacter palustris]QJR15849.1 HTH-type transcriptional regulator TtgR [Usitatibacter palustris]